MKTRTKGEKFCFPKNFTILLLLLALNVFAIHSPAMAQSSSSDQSKSEEGVEAKPPEPKKVKTLGPADEFNRGVPSQQSERVSKGST